MKKQLNVWIDGDLKTSLAERAQREKTSLKELTEAILAADMLRHRGKMLEQHLIPVIRDTMQFELQKACAQLLREVREEMAEEHAKVVHLMKGLARRSEQRMTTLLVPAVRNSSVNRHLFYVMLSKVYGATFAHETYEEAVQRSQEMASEVEPIALLGATGAGLCGIPPQRTGTDSHH